MLQHQQYQRNPQHQQRQIWFMVLRPEQRPEPEHEPAVVVIDEAKLRIFVLSVYISGAIFILATSITWLVISGTKFAFYPAVPVPYFVWIILAFLLLMTVNCIPQIRYWFPFNWMMTVIIVMLIAFAGACLMDLFPVLIVLTGLALSFAIVGMFYAMGALCPQKVLPGILCTACMSSIFVITLLVLCILICFLRNRFIGLALGIVLFCFVIIMMPFHARYIHGRLDIVPLFDMLHCVLSMYIHFTTVFYTLGYFYFYHKETM